MREVAATGAKLLARQPAVELAGQRLLSRALAPAPRHQRLGQPGRDFLIASSGWEGSRQVLPAYA